MTTDHLWAWTALAMVLLAGWAILADRRRMKRTNLDRVGFMPWTSISVLALVIAAFAASLALRGF